ncbi:protein kinase-like domain, concanavalin A-like lectin/glucanase domain protein [Tanacetum coccineum]
MHYLLMSQVKNIEHLRINLKDIWEAKPWSDGYKLECFDRDYIPSVKRKNKAKLPKKLYTVDIKAVKMAKDFYSELEIASCCEHHNIQPLLGFCDEGSHLILVYKYLSDKNSLRECLRTCTLTWEQRLKICIDIAQGLHYLHYEMEDQKTVIHNDICLRSIVLDDNWGARIVGFKSSVFLPLKQDEVAFDIERFYKDIYYRDPEYSSKKLRRESDVFSFGVVMSEILFGFSIHDFCFDPKTFKKRNLNFFDKPLARRWFDEGIIKNEICPALKETYCENNFILHKGPDEDSLDTFIQIMYECLAPTHSQRPTMKVVIAKLEKALSLQENNQEEAAGGMMEVNDHDATQEKIHGDDVIVETNDQGDTQIAAATSQMSTSSGGSKESDKCLMRALSLNIRGLGAEGKTKWINELVDNNKPLILGLQETKMDQVDENIVQYMWRSESYAYAKVDALGSAGGIITIWDNSWFFNTSALGEEGLLAVVGSWKGKEDAAWCIFGDFNEVRNVDERKNSGFNRRGADLFNNFITGDELIDIPLGGKRFTRVSDDGLKFSKIDRFLVNSRFCDFWSSLVVVAKEIKLSDHCPLMLVDKVFDFGPKPFRFFDVWLDDSECEKVVADCWKKQVFSVKADCIFRDKLKNVKEGLKEWSKVMFERNNKDIEDLKNEATKWELVAESRDLDVAELDRWKEARKGWLEKDRRNNEMKKQKSRVKWVLEGDEKVFSFVYS